MKYATLGIVLIAMAGCQSSNNSGNTDSATANSVPSVSSPDPAVSGTDSAAPQPSESTSGAGETSTLPNEVPPKPNIPITPPVQKPGKNGWQATTLKLPEVAAKLNASLSNMKQTECRARALITTPGGRGTIFLAYLVESPNLYRVEYLEPDAEPRRVVILSDGKTKQEMTPKGISVAMPVEKPMMAIKDLSDPSRFAREFSRTFVSGIADRSNAMSALAKNLMLPNSGFNAVVEERHSVYDNKPRINYRIWAKRTPEAEKKFGAAEFEIVLDPVRWVPVTMRTESIDQKGRKWSYDWTAGWKFGTKIDKSLFSFKTPPFKDDKPG